MKGEMGREVMEKSLPSKYKAMQGGLSTANKIVNESFICSFTLK